MYTRGTIPSLKNRPKRGTLENTLVKWSIDVHIQYYEDSIDPSYLQQIIEEFGVEWLTCDDSLDPMFNRS
jgi:hypothetical protein